VKRLEGRIAIVTGASRGIGAGIALGFAREGAKLVLTARSAADLDAVAAGVRAQGTEALCVPADLGSEDDIRRIAEETQRCYGRADILVNNAGIIHPPIDLVDFDAGLWRRVMDVNLTGAALLAKAVLPGMIAQHSGKIINISSVGGRRGGKGRSAYRVTKAGLISLTESLAAELKPHGIDVTCICPGGVDTPGFRDAFPAGKGPSGTSGLMAPDEIAQVAIFLASDASSAITGAIIDAFGNSNPLFR
jgi:NAD(P)-dependent dehydrogenase (short-subunit alcohol dehydrogenase family)